MKKARQSRYAVVYDITSNSERRCVDRLLKGWGHRVQKSVFSVTTTRTGMAQIKAAIGGLSLETGSVLVFRVQTGTQIDAIGKPYADPDANVAYVV